MMKFKLFSRLGTGALCSLLLLAASLVTSSPIVPIKTRSISVPSIVSTAWLEENFEVQGLLVVDVRDASSYTNSHVPGSLSIPFAYDSLWGRTSSDETLVMPPGDELLPDLAAHGFTLDSGVVIVTNTATMPNQMTMATRVAATLRYAGFPVSGQIGILDGGFPAWTAAGGAVIPGPTPTPEPVNFTGVVNDSFIVDREYVRDHIGLAEEGTVLIDVRPLATYDDGHIESALSLPLTTVWTTDAADLYHFKSEEELLSLFEAAVGSAPVSSTQGEVIVYCYIGLMASGWLYVLSHVLGFENVKLYDGSTTDWVKYYPLVPSD